MKWTTTVALLAGDLVYAKTAGHVSVRRNRQLQADESFDYYYPLDVTVGICSNDPAGRPSSYTEIGYTLFETREACCAEWYNWQIEGNCMRNEKISAPKEIVPVEEPAATTESESTAADSDTVFFYPMDLVTGKCSSDASQRPSNFDAIGFTLFFTRELCCQFWYGWQEDQTCLLNLPTDPEIPSFVTPEDPTDTPDGGDNGGGGGQSSDKFYLVDNACSKSTNGVMVGNFYATKFDCCTNISDFDLRRICCNESVDDAGTQLECLLVEPAGPAGEGGDDPVVFNEEEQFYVSNRSCYSTAEGNPVGTLYSSRDECCNSLSKEDRHACVWNNTPGGALAQAPPSSASHFAMGGYMIAAAMCLCFQFM